MASVARRSSYDVLRDLVKRVTAKRFSHQTNIALSLAYSWQRDPEQAAEEDFDHTARRNPIDRTEDIIRCAVIEGHHDIAVEIMDSLARQFGGAYVSNKEVQAIKRVAELDLTKCKVAESDLATLKRVADVDQGNGHNSINNRCLECGRKNEQPDSWRPYSQFCNDCYSNLKSILDREGFVIVRRNQA